jgi:hypothetical protein
MIRGVGAPPPVSGGTRQARDTGGFRMPKSESAPTSGIAGPAAIGTPSMLALQEMPDPHLADREARRRGQDILAALAALQRALLGAGPIDADALARLAKDVPQASDPALRAAVAALVLRARIEAARLEAPGQSPPRGA